MSPGDQDIQHCGNNSLKAQVREQLANTEIHLAATDIEVHTEGTWTFSWTGLSC